MKWKGTYRKTGCLLSAFLLVNILVKLFFFEIYHVGGHSMRETLLDGDYVLVSKSSYGLRLPRTVLEIPWVNQLLYYTLPESWLEKLVPKRATAWKFSGAPVDEFHTFIDSVYCIRQEEYDETVLYRQYRRQARTDTVLKGRVIGTDKTSIYHPEAVKENVFDGDGLTYFHTADSLSWAGLELSSPATINQIRYLIRNDDNGVRKGNVYELFYIGSDFAWVSAGRKTADEDDRIHFDNVPEGTVYWLRNLTRGKEERIFTYNNGQQIWW